MNCSTMLILKHLQGTRINAWTDGIVFKVVVVSISDWGA